MIKIVYQNVKMENGLIHLHLNAWISQHFVRKVIMQTTILIIVN
jgi:hypothetical protein